MDAQDFRSLQEAYLDVYEQEEVLDEITGGKGHPGYKAGSRDLGPMQSGHPADSSKRTMKGGTMSMRHGDHLGDLDDNDDDDDDGLEAGLKDSAKKSRENVRKPLRNMVKTAAKRLNKESYDLYDLILSHLIDEGYAETPEAAEAIMVNMSEDWKQDIMEKEDSEYEKASDAALDKRYGYGRASGDKRSFGRAANRSSAAAALRAIRRGERSGSGTSREAGSDAVHQGWAKTAKTSTDQTPEKKEKRKKLADTSYSNLPDDEKEKDRVSFDAVRAIYNKNKK